MFDSDNYARIENDNTSVCTRKDSQRSRKKKIPLKPKKYGSEKI